MVNNYKHTKIAITGANGFLGSEIFKKLGWLNASVIALHGDVRDSKTFAQLDYSFDYLFHFAAPSSQTLFKRDMAYCIDATVNGFLNAAYAAKENGIKLIYPSTGVLSYGIANEYSKTKSILEDIHMAEGLNALGLRIFATYGNEYKKGDYASVIYLFVKDMLQNRPPVIFGDGNQQRDFIYIDDVVNTILALAWQKNGIIDIGSGMPVSFNNIVRITNNVIGKKIKPQYIPKPQSYVDETKASTDSHKYYRPKVSIEQGIKNVIQEINA